MNIYTVVTPSHECLLEGWENSIRRDPVLEPYSFIMDVSNNGDYGNAEWHHIISSANRMYLEFIKRNHGTIIGILGVDVYVIKPIFEEVTSRMNGHDILFQQELEHDTVFNPDVAFIRCNDRVVDGWSKWLDTLEEWDGHLPHQNTLMSRAFEGVSVGLLPLEYASESNGGRKETSVLYHANCTLGPDSVQKKIDKLNKWGHPNNETSINHD